MKKKKKGKKKKKRTEENIPRLRKLVAMQLVSHDSMRATLRSSILKTTTTTITLLTPRGFKTPQSILE